MNINIKLNKMTKIMKKKHKTVNKFIINLNFISKINNKK